MRFADKAAAWLVCILGIAHLAVGRMVFVEPNEKRIWFASAGFLLVVTGLANLGAQAGRTRMQSLAAAASALSILIIGALLAQGDPKLLFQPQTLTLLALGALLIVQRLREVLTSGTI